MLVYYHYKSLNENFNQVLELRKKTHQKLYITEKKNHKQCATKN